MKVSRNIFWVSAALMATVADVHAATAARVYSSGLLVVLFLGFCALLLVIQLVPAVITIIGMIRGVAKKDRVKEMTSAGSAE
ncbi:MAG: hypothetical protein EG824_07570 [Deltaproteobacteria bacterium]|nr:hypothetical protein [Deltaproteobacteria bacterium]